MGSQGLSLNINILISSFFFVIVCRYSRNSEILCQGGRIHSGFFSPLKMCFVSNNLSLEVKRAEKEAIMTQPVVERFCIFDSQCAESN